MKGLSFVLGGVRSQLPMARNEIAKDQQTMVNTSLDKTHSRKAAHILVREGYRRPLLAYRKDEDP